MSFLLDALRKSERQRRLGDVPSIHSTTELESRVTGKPWQKAVMVLLLLALGLVGWYGWRWYAPPEQAIVAQPSRPLESPVMADSSGSRDPNILPDIPRLGLTDTDQVPGRTAVERYSDPDSSGPDSHNEPENSFSDSPPQADDPTQVSETDMTEIVATMVAEQTDGDIQDKEELDQQPYQPGLISYWQLPESVRQQFQAFHISVIVFAKKPEDRFILLNGVRLVEGDQVERDLVLEEIRREGAVFSFRHYQFLVTQ